MSERPDKPLIMLPGPASDPSEDLTHGERRANFRYPFTAAAEVVDVRSQTRIVGRCADLGPSGCYIDTLSPFAEGAVVQLRLEREVQEFEALGVVAYSRMPMGMGLTFTEIRPEHRDVLKTWLAKLSSKQSPELDEVAAGPESNLRAAIENVQQVLNELINLMVRKKVISENEGAGLLRQMFR